MCPSASPLSLAISHALFDPNLRWRVDGGGGAKQKSVTFSWLHRAQHLTLGFGSSRHERYVHRTGSQRQQRSFFFGVKWPPICQLFSEKFATAPSGQHLALNRPSPSKRRKFLALPRTGERCSGTGGRKLQKPAKRPNKKSVGHPSSDRPSPTASDATIRGKNPPPQSCRHAIRVAFSKRIVHIHTHTRARKKKMLPCCKKSCEKISKSCLCPPQAPLYFRFPVVLSQATLACMLQCKVHLPLSTIPVFPSL